MEILVNLDVMMARRKMSAGELAERVGITPANLSILKNNKAKAVRFSTLMALCHELDCQPGDVLFIDEIHRLPRVIEEMLYSAMEDFYVDIIIGEGPEARPVHFPLPPFTLIGATTRAGALSAPLRDRFGIVVHMQYYNVDELSQVALRTGNILNAQIEEAGAYEIARRSRGTPRVANRLLKRVRDIAEVKADGIIDELLAKQALALLDVDENGLDATDKQMLQTMIETYRGGPVGLTTIAANIGEEIDTIEDMIEPYLLQIGVLQRTPRGRIVTETGYNYLGYPYIDKEKT